MFGMMKKKNDSAQGTKTNSKKSKSDIAYEKKKTSKRTWVVLVVIALLASYVLLKPYISIILLATLMAVLFNGVYHGLLKKFKGSRPKAALLVTVYSVLVFGIPIIIILALATQQALTFIHSLQLGDLSNGTGSFNLDEVTKSIVDGINSAADAIIGNSHVVNYDQVNDFISTAIPEVLQAFTNLLLGIVRSVPALFMNAIIYFFVFTGLLVNQENIAKRLRYLSPFSKRLNDKYVTRGMAMAKAMLKGQLLIAFLQGLAGALSMAIIGFGEYFVFFLLIFTLMNMVPLGSGIIIIPLGILLVLLGDVWQGLFLLGVHFIITTNIDNIVRPMVVPKDAWLPASLTIMSAIGGVIFFGLPGVIYGPIIMILIMTTLEEYTDMKMKHALASESSNADG